MITIKLAEGGSLSSKTCTVAELIAALKKVPLTATVRFDDNIHHNTYSIRELVVYGEYTNEPWVELS